MSARYFEEIIHATIYSKFRPTAPPSLVSKVVSYLKEKYLGNLAAALDVGCGSGQSTRELSSYFSQVTGSDISEAQINEAISKEKCQNICYKVSSAETLPFEDQSFQLVTAGQSCHWFDLPKFYKEADRILVPNGVLAMYGYGFPRPHYADKGDQLCRILDQIYDVDTKGYWGSERIFVDQRYTDKRFEIPFTDRIREEILFESTANVKDIQGYVMSWSGFQKYKNVNGDEAGQKILDRLVEDMMDEIGDPTKTPETTQLTLKYKFFLIMGRK